MEGDECEEHEQEHEGEDGEGVARMFNLLWLVIVYCFYCLVTFFFSL